MAIAAVAKEDFPDNWPQLIPHILHMLQVASRSLTIFPYRC